MSHESSTEAIPAHGEVPRHVAVIMDGNGRWAKRRLLPRFAGHRRGVAAVRSIVQACAERGVRFLTLFAFSSENWRRPAEEVALIMQLFHGALSSEVEKLHRNGVRLRVVGDLERFDSRMRALIEQGERLTAANTGLTLTIAANYGGRWDILQALGRLLRERPEAAQVPIEEAQLARYLSMSYAPEPDLFIRTGGEQRVSNFLLWQLAYTELYFTETLWPDFDGAALDAAIASYARRERRFGRTSDQLRRRSAPRLHRPVRLPEGLWLRVATALLLLGGLLAALLLLDRLQLAMLLGAVIALAGHEWGRLAGFSRPAAAFYGVACAALFGLAVIALPAAPRAQQGLFAASALFWIMLAPAWMRGGLGRSARALLGAAGFLVLVPAGLAALALPVERLLPVMGLVWVADTAAYFAGRAFGARKLAPVISPGKTWEGVAGAVAATLIYAIICAVPGAPFAATARGAGWIPYLVGVVLLCALSVVGDLFESALKRQAGAKDSGTLLPGHGGVLDRIDSMTSTLPIAALLLSWTSVT